ncbi:MAG: hypothetical protein IJ744_01255 [Lachnospiraceae bacterium]|nr:hypothetical protein [Lachnospiraceae bacterium]
MKFSYKVLLVLLMAMMLSQVVLPAKASAYTEVTVTESMQVTDSLNGVDTWYRPGRNDGSSTTYSCAAYVKRYYEEIYGVHLTGLIGQVIPNTNCSDDLIVVDDPQVGDIIRERTHHGTTHWAIVKEVKDDGTVIAIEQNWKYRTGGQTLARVDREMEEDRCVYLRLESVDEALLAEEAAQETAAEVLLIEQELY